MRASAGPRLVAAAMLAAVSMVLAPGPAGADGSGGGRGGWRTVDTVTVNGYDDYRIDRTVDVVQRTSGNNLVFWFTAGQPMVDGSIVIELPARDWATTIQEPTSSGLAPDNAGDVGVRPQPPEFPGPGDPAQYCSQGASYTFPDGTAHAYVFELTVSNTDRVRRVEAEHLTCAAGQKIAVRIVGLSTPRTGLYNFSVRAFDRNVERRVADPRLVVRPTPPIRLAIDDITSPVSAWPNPPQVTVRALTPAGRPARGYSGTIRLYTDPVDCAVENKGYKDVEVSEWKRGIAKPTFPFALSGTRTLIAEDIDHRAVAARSNPFTVVDPNPFPQCPASYH